VKCCKQFSQNVYSLADATIGEILQSLTSSAYDDVEVEKVVPRDSQDEEVTVKGRKTKG
jgi:hypothetical protein